jgi:predicted DNA-binding protein (MmcQ/YjbR family)
LNWSVDFLNGCARPGSIPSLRVTNPAKTPANNKPSFHTFRLFFEILYFWSKPTCMTHSEFRQLALTFPESSEAPHFEKTSFRVQGKKIFATMSEPENQAVLKLTEVQQSVYCVFDKTACYPVPNKWGKQGWTIVQLEKVDAAFALDILKISYCNVAPKKLAILLETD